MKCLTDDSDSHRLLGLNDYYESMATVSGDSPLTPCGMKTKMGYNNG